MIDYYAPALAILEACQHITANPCEVKMADGRRLSVCCECWNSHVTARKAARKQELAAHNAILPRCQKCGVRPAKWTVARFHLCGACKTAAMKEHNRNLAKAGAFAIFATGLMVDLRTWAAFSKGA